MFFNYFFTKRRHLTRLGLSLSSILKTKVNKQFLKELLVFSGFGLFVGTYGIFSEFVCRSIVVENLGVDKIGLYSPIITWAGLFTGFIIPSFSTYLYPRFAETKSNKEISGILNDAFRLSTFALLPLLFLAIPFRVVLIRLFYSKEFLAAAAYLPYHFIGIIFYVWWYIFSQSMTPTGRIKQHATFYTLYMTLDIIVTYITVPKWGLYGWMLKAIISPVIFYIVYLLYLKRSIGFKYLNSNILIMAYLFIGSILLILTGLFINKNITYVLGPVLLLFSWFLLQKSERMLILKKLYSLIRNKRS